MRSINKISNKRYLRTIKGTIPLFLLILSITSFYFICNIFSRAEVQAQESVVIGQTKNTGESQHIWAAFFSAAIAVSLGSIGAGIAVGQVGAAAMGVIGEKPELSGRALIFVGLAEGIAIYGLIIGIMILAKV